MNISPTPLIIIICWLAVCILFQSCSPGAMPSFSEQPTPTATSSGGLPESVGPSEVVVSTSPASTLPPESTLAVSTPIPDDQSGKAVEYRIYVGLNRTGAACGPYNNAGGFSTLSLNTAFSGAKFIHPSNKPVNWPAGMPFEGCMFSKNEGNCLPFGSVLGQGDIDTYSFCPTYEGEEVYQCSVIDGPKPFDAILQVPPRNPEDIPVVPLVTVDPLDQGPQIYLQYVLIGAAGGMGVVIRGSDRVLGYCDGIGGPYGGMTLNFEVSWARLSKGEGFAIERELVDDSGNVDHWTIRFVPEKSIP